MNRKDTIKKVLLCSVTLCVCVLMFKKTSQCTEGIKEGLYLCATTVIPSLFPFMIVSQFILKSGICDVLGNVFHKFTVKAFHLPGVATGVILMSLIGGFPVGAKMTNDLLWDGKITKNEAQRLNLFCINAGPAFIIGTVGTMFLSSRKAGIILYVSTCTASLIIGLLTAVLSDKRVSEFDTPQGITAQNPVTAFTQSTSDAAKTMLSICAWIIIFNAVIKCIISVTTIQSSALITICSILEVTNGIRLSLGVLPVPALAAILSFGGISVHCQIYSYIAASGLSFRHFYTARILCAAVSCLICTALMKVFPCDIQVFSSASQVVMSAYSISLPAATALIIMCAIMIFEVDTDQKVC